MRRTAIVSVYVLIAVTAVGALALTGIEGSKHDFSNEDWAGEDACGACHTPHRSVPPKTAPLWDTSADLSRTFGTSAADGSTPGRGTTLCLRCHDGTIAPAGAAGAHRESFAFSTHPGAVSTGYATSEHPVGVEYPRTDKGFRPLTSVVASGTVTLPDGMVECVSCHDPHDEAGLYAMLVTSNARSALCLTCHKK